MKKFFKWLNGKKSTIAMLILFLATFLNEVVIGQWEAHQDWLPKLISTLNWIGMALGTTGMIHKGIKASKEITNDPPKD